MARWVVVVVLVVAALVVATRRLSGITRVSASAEIGRRHPWAVTGWPLIRLGVAAVAAGLAFLVATAGPHAAAPRHPAAAVPPPSAAVSAAPSAAPAADGGGIPVWLLAVLLAVLVAGIATYATSRRRGARELAYLLADYDDDQWRAGSATRRGEYQTRDDPWELAGTDPTERVDITEEPDEQAGSSGRGDSGHADVDDADGEGHGLEVEDLVVPRAGASIHDLTRRRRPDRRL